MGGRLVATRFLALTQRGEQRTFVYRRGWPAGLYTFRLTARDHTTGAVTGLLNGKLILTD